MKVTLKRVKDGSDPVWQVRYWQGGRYIRKQFRSRSLAEEYRTALEQDADAARRDDLPPAEKLSVMTAYRRALEGGYSLAQACDAHERSVGSALKRKPLGEAIAEFLEAKAAKGLRDRSLKDLRVRLSRFGMSVGETIPVSSISTNRIEGFIDRSWEPQTKINWLVVLGNFFRWSMRRRYSLTNPVADIERPILEQDQPCPLTVEVCGKLLRDTLEKAPSLLPYVAISLFAGLRNSELGRLAWSDVDLSHGVIRVEAGKAKTRSRRVVAIEPCLKEWLKLGGDLPPKSLQRLWKLVRPQGYHVDQMRRTFCSYHLAAFGSAARTALEAGHRESVLFRHYRGIAETTYAKTFWELIPGAGTTAAPASIQ